MKFFEFIEAKCAGKFKSLAFRFLPISRSGFYAWRKRKNSEPGPKARRRRELLQAIEEQHTTSDGTYGAPRITAELQDKGVMVNEKTVAAIMAAHGIEGISPRRFRVVTTVPDPSAAVPADLVGRQWDKGAPDLVWSSDITYLECGEGIMYLCAIRDEHTKRVLAWTVADHMRESLVVKCLEKAIAARGGRVAGVVFHSDRGGQYMSHAVRKVCEYNFILPSVGRTGVCWDNAPAESFWSTFKHERFYRRSYATFAELRADINRWMHWYNGVRRHSTIGMISPMAYESSIPGMTQAA